MAKPSNYELVRASLLRHKDMPITTMAYAFFKAMMAHHRKA